MHVVGSTSFKKGFYCWRERIRRGHEEGRQCERSILLHPKQEVRVYFLTIQYILKVQDSCNAQPRK